MTLLYLASNPGAAKTFREMRGRWDELRMGMLVAFPYLQGMRNLIAKHEIRPRCWMLDSGAYSAWCSGKEIDMEALTEESKSPFWDEAVALDAIGDPQRSLENALRMKENGSPAFPVHHIGESLELLDEYARHFRKVGLSCRFGEPVPDSMRYLEGCFSRHWPMRYHSFGWVSRRMLLTFPFETADTATWTRAPSAWGTWTMSFRGRLPIQGHRDLRPEVDAYQRLQDEVAWRWRRELDGANDQVSGKADEQAAGGK
ncbi:MAG: hypothetical protein GY769_07980 [bacterium]|nr:hypothetical protein [bacterium]